MILEKIFKYDGLNKEQKSNRKGNEKINIWFHRWHLRKTDWACYYIRLGFHLPEFNWKREIRNEVFYHDKHKEIGVHFDTHVKFCSEWGFRSIHFTLFGFGIYFAFQDGGF